MISVEIFYAALNLRDVMLAIGKITLNSNYEPPIAPDTDIGLEYSGLASGKRVMGICNYGAIGLQRKTSKHRMWEIPDHWSLEEAATVPIVYATVSIVH